MTTDDALPFGADTDDAVVAMLDGRLAEFAAAHDLTEAAARERLEQWPGLGARISTVVAARRTTRAGRRAPANLGVIIGAVVAILVIVAVAVIVIARPDSSEPAPKAAHAHIMDAYIGSVGEIGTDEALRTAIQRRGPVDQGLGTGATGGRVLNGSGVPIAAERCVRVNLPGRSVTLLASGTWRTQPVVVYVAGVTGARVAFVSDLSSCAIVYSLRL